MSTQNATPSNTAEASGMILGHIAPEPTESEREAIRLALEQISSDLMPSAPSPLQSDSKWRFSGRWWNQSSLAGQARRF